MVLALVISGLVFGCGERAGEREFASGVRQYERGRLVRARDAFEQSINARPGHPANARAFHYLGVIAAQLEDADGAAAYFERSRELDPRLYEPVFNLAVLTFEDGEWGRARMLFRSAAQLQPENPRPLEYLAETYWAEGEWADARRNVEAALERAPHSPRLLTALGVLDWRADEEEQAVAHWMRALEANPDFGPALYNLAVLYGSDPALRADALTLFQDYLDTTPSDAQRRRARSHMEQLQADEEYRTVTATPVRDPVTDPATDPPQVVPDEEAVPTPPTWAERMQQARRLADEGRTSAAVAMGLRLVAQAQREGQDDRVEQALRQTLEFDPRAPAALQEFGRWHAAQGRHDEALRWFQRTVEEEPEWGGAWAALADSAWAVENLDVALNAQRQAVALAPDDADQLWQLAERYEEAGVRRRAEEVYQQFITTFPDDPRIADARRQVRLLRPPAPPPTAEPEPAPPPTREPARNVIAARETFQRGVAYQRRGDLDNALSFFRRAIQLDPELDVAHHNIGLIHLRRREFSAARAAFARTLELRSDNITAMYNLAVCEYELGTPWEAVSRLDSVLHIDPDFAPAHLLLGSIYAGEARTRREAIHHYRRFLELRPNDAQAPAVRAWLNNQS